MTARRDLPVAAVVAAGVVVATLTGLAASTAVDDPAPRTTPNAAEAGGGAAGQDRTDGPGPDGDAEEEPDADGSRPDDRSRGAPTAGPAHDEDDPDDVVRPDDPPACAGWYRYIAYDDFDALRPVIDGLDADGHADEADAAADVIRNDGDVSQARIDLVRERLLDDHGCDPERS